MKTFTTAVLSLGLLVLPGAVFAEVCSTTTATIVSSTNTQVEAGTISQNAVETYRSPIWTAIPNAMWIWKSQFVSSPNSIETTTFTEAVQLSGTVNASILTISADDYFTVVVNGIQLISEFNEGNFLAPKIYDIASSLQSGTNTVTITAINAAHFYTGLGTELNNPGGVIYSLITTTQTCTPTSTDPIDNNPGSQGGSSSGAPSSQATSVTAPAPIVAGAFITSSSTENAIQNDTRLNNPIVKNSRLAIATQTTEPLSQIVTLDDATSTATSTFTAGTTTTPIEAGFTWVCIVIALAIMLAIYIVGEFMFNETSQVTKRILFYLFATIIAVGALYYFNNACAVIPLIIIAAITSILAYFKIV